MQTNRLRPIGEDIPAFFGEPQAPTAAEPATAAPGARHGPPGGTMESAAASMLLTSLRALSQRALVALGNLFVLATAASAFWLWYVTCLPEPSVHQLIGLGLYGLLILALNRLVLARR